MITEGASGRLVLVRHGQGSLGTEDYDRLSDVGWVQAKRLGERLNELTSSADDLHVCSGSLKRHHQTVEAMTLPFDAVVDERLNEYRVDQLITAAMAQGGRLGLDVPDESQLADPKAYLDTFLAWFPSVLSEWQSGRLSCAHNGPWDAFYTRVIGVAEAWTEHIAKGRTVVSVTSAGVISTLVAKLMDESLAWQRQCNVTLYNASVTELLFTPSSGWQLIRLNCVEHLTHEQHTLA